MKSGLRKIIFLITYIPRHELLGRTFMELWLAGYEAERLSEERVSKIVRECGAAKTAKEGAAYAGRAGAEKEEPAYTGRAKPYEEILVVTDRPDIADACCGQNCAVIGYLHERNGEESFGGVRYLIEDISGLDAHFCELAYCRAHGIPRMILETERCMVREIAPSDVDRLYEIYAQPGMTEHMEPLYADRRRELSYTEDYIANVYGFYGYGMWIVLDKKDGTVIGRAGIEPKGDGAELGYVIAREYQNRGYATEVCREILAYAAETLGLTEIYARIKEENIPSARVCGKLGFQRVPESGEGRQAEQIWVRKL